MPKKTQKICPPHTLKILQNSDNNCGNIVDTNLVRRDLTLPRWITRPGKILLNDAFKKPKRPIIVHKGLLYKNH